MQTRLQAAKQTIKNLPYRKIVDISDAFIDGMYLAESVVDYTSCIMTNDLSEAVIEKQDFYQGSNIPLALLGMIALTGYSVYCRAIKQKKDHLDAKKNELALLIMSSWPYIRDCLSGIKNGRHAVVNTGFIAQHLSGTSLYHLTNPIGIAVGAALAINLLCYRKMNNNRKLNLQANELLLKKIIENNLPELSDETIQTQCTAIKFLCYTSAFFNGITDGAYLYGCLFILLSLGITLSSGGAVLIAAIAFCTAITLISIICRLDEEYQEQKTLQQSANACHSALSNNRGETGADEKDLKPSGLKKNLINIGFFAVRNGISGAKNAKAAIDSIKAFFSNLIIKAVLSAIAVVGAIFYAAYLVITNLFTAEPRPMIECRQTKNTQYHQHAGAVQSKC